MQNVFFVRVNTSHFISYQIRSKDLHYAISMLKASVNKAFK